MRPHGATPFEQRLRSAESAADLTDGQIAGAFPCSGCRRKDTEGLAPRVGRWRAPSKQGTGVSWRIRATGERRDAHEGELSLHAKAQCNRRSARSFVAASCQEPEKSALERTGDLSRRHYRESVSGLGAARDTDVGAGRCASQNETPSPIENKASVKAKRAFLSRRLRTRWGRPRRTASTS